MRKAIVAVCALLAVALALTAVPATRDEMHWHWALYQNTAEAYRSYAAAWPEGRNISAAEGRLDEFGWAEAERSNTVRAYQAYVAAHPHGRFLDRAEAKSAALRSNLGLYQSAVEAGKEESIVAFLADHPGHVMEAAAHLVLAEFRIGRDIVDLIEEGKVEVEAQGSGIRDVLVRVRKLVTLPLTVRIPVGTYFVSANPAAQNMVATANQKVQLTTADWKTVAAEAACANMPKKVPDAKVRFTVQRSPFQADLMRLMPVLERARVDFKIRQAAVWIITDNAGFDQLGVLVVSRGGVVGERLIGETDAARAMHICQNAGIDISTKSIWRDRPRLATALGPGELKTWFDGLEAIDERKARERAIAEQKRLAAERKKEAERAMAENEREIINQTKAIELNPRSLWAFLSRGVAYGKKGEYDLEIADYTKAIELEPKFVGAYNNRGIAYKNKGDYERSIADYTKIIEIDPKTFVAYNNRCYAYFKKGMYDLGIADCTKSIELDPKRAVSFNNRGLAYAGKGQHRRAVEDYDRALAIDPKYAQVYLNRGASYATGSGRSRTSEPPWRLTAIHQAKRRWCDSAQVREHRVGRSSALFRHDTLQGLQSSRWGCTARRSMP